MISLIVTTRNRRADLARFLAHLQEQSYRDFELVLVDQNAAPGVFDLIEKHSFRRQYLPTNERGASRGRNIGLQAAQGEIIAIPDDDCWYPPTLLQEVMRFFENRSDVDVLSVLECSEDGNAIVPKHPSSAGWCDAQPVLVFEHRSAWLPQSSMIFFRRRVYEAIGLFPAWMGVGAGTEFGSGEETDFLLRALLAGFTMWFEPSIRVFHPPIETREREAEKNYEYAIGRGALMRRHGCGFLRLAASVCRIMGGALWMGLRLNRQRTMMYLRRAKGVVIGYFTLPAERRLNGQRQRPASRYIPES